MQRPLLNTGKEISIGVSLTAHSEPPPLQKTGLSEELSLLTMKAQDSVGHEAASSSVANPAVHVPPTDPEPAFNAVRADAKPAPAKATGNKKAKSKTTAKTGAKVQTEHTTLTQMDPEARVDVDSNDKARQQAIAAQIEATNNAGSGRRGAPGLKRKPKAHAVTIPSVAQLEQASLRTRNAKQ